MLRSFTVLIAAASFATPACGQLLSPPSGAGGMTFQPDASTAEGATGEAVAAPTADDAPADRGAEGANGDSKSEATAVTANYAAQPLATYDTRTGGWLPDCNATSSTWMPEIEPPAGYINCNCNGQSPGPRCRLWRSYVKPTDPSIDQRCVVCVKEPCIGYETVEEEERAVLYRCFESSEPFRRHGCEGGQWYEEKGAKRIRKLHPCEIKVPLKYEKPVVKYRDVYYYIQCDHTGA